MSERKRGEADLDAREAARALKAALAEADAESDDEMDTPRPRRRRRPPTSHGEPLPRPVRRRATVAPEPIDPKLVRPGVFARHDLAVVLGALVVLGAGSVAYRSLTAVEVEPLATLGLSLDRPAALLPPVDIGTPGQTAAKAGDGTPLPYHVEYQSPTSPLLRLEIQIEERPTYNNLHAARALDRVSRYGEMYWAEPTETVKIAGRNWLRTRFRYGYKADEFGSPQIASGVELSTLNGGLLYAVTAHGTPGESDELAELFAPTLDVDANHPAASFHHETP